MTIRGSYSLKSGIGPGWEIVAMLCEVSVNIGDDHRSFSYCGGDSLDRISSYIPHRIHTRNACSVRRALEAVPGACENEPFLVQLHRAKQPSGVRLGTNHDKDTCDRPCYLLASFAVRPRNELETQITLKRLDFRITVKRDVWRLADTRDQILGHRAFERGAADEVVNMFSNA
jgi:hypothetical protein